MPRPFVKIAEAPSDEGPLTLHQRGDDDFLLLVDGRVLMTSALKASEIHLAEAACDRLVRVPSPRVLIGGLGLGFTLKAALDRLPSTASVTVAELNGAVVDWCKGPVARANGGAALDPRVRFYVGNVTSEIEVVAEQPQSRRYDAIVWDLYVGPTRTGQHDHPLYGKKSIEKTRAALESGGVFGVWCETPSDAFENRLKNAGFTVELVRTKGRGLKHAVYVATAKAQQKT